LTAEYPAPGLKNALEHLPRPGASVLDLGPALGANVAYFGGLGARLRIADLERSIDDEGAREAIPAIWERKLVHLLPFDDGERFDLVLAWDLPNYLGRERWPAVVRRIVERLAPGGAFHLLARVGTEMPARPSLFRIVAPGILSEQAIATSVVPAPRLPHAEVEKMNPGLVAPRSHLGKQGMQEYLLEHAAAHNLPPRAVAKPRPQRARTF
jgi:hypothetical protein